MKKIVCPTDLSFYPDQLEQLQALGNVKTFSQQPSAPEEWLGRCQRADIVCSGKFGLTEKIYELRDVFITVPFVGVGWIDKEKLKERNVTLSYSPGCNRHAVSEWIIGMMINLFRDLPRFINTHDTTLNHGTSKTSGLFSKQASILGKGNIGSRVGMVCEALGMDVKYFTRADDIQEKVKHSDVVIDCLSLNPSTAGLLNDNFFQSLKRGSFFITVTSSQIYDTNAILKALDDGILAKVATDVGHLTVADVQNESYLLLSRHPQVLATPHISYNTDVTTRIANDTMIENIKGGLTGKPIHILQ